MLVQADTPSLGMLAVVSKRALCRTVTVHADVHKLSVRECKRPPGWHAGLDSRTSLAAFFEVVAGSHGKAPDVGAAPQFFLQFVTKYLHENGEFRCRVTTVTRTCGSKHSALLFVLTS